MNFLAKKVPVPESSGPRQKPLYLQYTLHNTDFIYLIIAIYVLGSYQSTKLIRSFPEDPRKRI